MSNTGVTRDGVARRDVRLLLEGDFDRDVTTQETTGDVAQVTLFDPRLDFPDAGGEVVALGESQPDHAGEERRQQQLGHEGRYEFEYQQHPEYSDDHRDERCITRGLGIEGREIHDAPILPSSTS